MVKDIVVVMQDIGKHGHTKGIQQKQQQIQKQKIILVVQVYHGDVVVVVVVMQHKVKLVNMCHYGLGVEMVVKHMVGRI